MKKFLFSLLTLAAALTVASCQKELVGNPDPILGGPAVKATVSVNVNGVATKAFAAAENAKKLHIAFYSEGELVASISKVGAEAIDLSSTSYDYNIKLSRGVAYDIICWAEAAESPYALDFNAKTVTYKDNVSLTANNDAYDAFYGVASLTADQTKNAVDLTIELKRPFAQVNVLVPDGNAAAYTSFSSAMTVTVPTTMSLADGSLSGNPVAVTFANAAINEATIKDGHKYVAMNYVFAPAEAANYAVSFTVTPNVAGDAKTIDLDAVSLKRNRRTNLVGNIFDTDVDGNITVVIVPTPGNPEEQDIDAVAADLDISLDPTAALEVPVRGSVGFTITTNSTGTASVASADTDIATAALTTDDSAQATNTHTVTVTGVANGTTKVTVDIAAGQTKASLKPAQVVVTVKVGTGEDPVVEQVATPTFTPAAGEYNAAQSVEIACATAGAAISYKLGDGEWQSYSAAISVNENVTISAKATKEGMTDSEVATAAYTINISATPDFTTVAGLKALLGAESATFTGTLTDAVVSFIAGTSDAVIKDATGSILYHKESGHGLLQGQTISGDVVVDAVIYNGINEITNLTATVAGEESAVEPEVVTFAQLAADYAKYESAYVKVVGVTSKTTTTKKGNIEATQDATDYIVYTNVAISVNTGDIFTAEGTVTKYNTTEEIKVWKAADLTVTTAAPTLSATPASTTVKATATSVTWTITSNTDWTITPGTGVTASVTSGNGNADVTLTFAANTGSSAVTYTATASATGCDDVTITITQSAAGSSSDVTDTITSALLTATGTTYTDFSNVAATSSARYAGNSAKSSSGGIQLRSKNSNSGIVSTVSGGRVKSVTITVESGSNTIDVYGSNTAYTGAADLYATGDDGNQGTKIGSLTATGTIDFTKAAEEYAYVGIRSNNGAIYLTKVEIEWE